ncbi:hypothetical protein WMY93_022744 [Mugilogobius chulae]|uniref:Uncharacterized protein n=1 Tax=Mugilogobius chulae TaxID=88201 RepID=A0AAW0NHW7_9GOBI
MIEGFVKMSKGEALRGFVEQRLAASAEEIFAQFDRTIAEYEEKLRHYKENQRKQALLESVFSPRVVLLRADVKTSPGPGLNHGPNQEIPETSQIKDEPEEQSVQQLQVCVPESSAVCVKTEESSLLQQTELKQEETQGEDVSTESERDSENSSDTYTDEDWRAPLSSSDDEDYDNQIQIRTKRTTAQKSGLSSKYKSAPETSATVNNGDKSRTATGAEGKKNQCSVYDYTQEKGVQPTQERVFYQVQRSGLNHGLNQEIPETSQTEDEPEEQRDQHLQV